MITDNASAYMPAEVARLNDLLARDLGYSPNGHPLFKFEWTEDLFWPLYKTGSKVAEINTYSVPVISLDPNVPSGIESVEEKKLVPEYEKARMTDKYRNQWIVTAWLPPEGLREWVVQNNNDPQMDKAAMSQWASNFEGADYPKAGYRVCTNYVIPKGDTPNIDDVIRFCAGVRYNHSMSSVELGQRMNDDYDRLHPLPITNPEEYNPNTEIGAAISEGFNAFMNPTPGKRGGSVSIGGVGENPNIRRKKKAGTN